MFFCFYAIVAMDGALFQHVRRTSRSRKVHFRGVRYHMSLSKRNRHRRATIELLLKGPVAVAVRSLRLSESESTIH